MRGSKWPSALPTALTQPPTEVCLLSAGQCPIHLLSALLTPSAACIDSAPFR